MLFFWIYVIFCREDLDQCLMTVVCNVPFYWFGCQVVFYTLLVDWWLCGVFTAPGLWLRGGAAALHCSALDSHWGGFSCCRPPAPGDGASAVRLSCELLCRMRELPASGTATMSPPSTGRSLNTGKQGKSYKFPSCVLYLWVVCKTL